MLECARTRGEQFRAQLWEAILVAYKESIDSEHDNDVLADKLHGVAQCVEELGPGIVTEEHLQLIVDSMINKQMNEYASRAQQREKGNFFTVFSKKEKEGEHDLSTIK